jgi:hypothetical protein
MPLSGEWSDRLEKVSGRARITLIKTIVNSHFV